MHLSFIYAKNISRFIYCKGALRLLRLLGGGSLNPLRPSRCSVAPFICRCYFFQLDIHWTMKSVKNLWQIANRFGPTCFVWGAVFKETPNSPAGTPAIATICARVQTPIVSYYFHTIGDGHQPNSRGSYTHYKDFLLKVA